MLKNETRMEYITSFEAKFRNSNFDGSIHDYAKD